MKITNKTFDVVSGTGETLTARQLGTFASYIKGEQFRFVVTQLPFEPPAITHRISGRRVCQITPTEIAASRYNMVDAGKSALRKLVQNKGADRIHDVLRSAEKTKGDGIGRAGGTDSIGGN